MRNLTVLLLLAGITAAGCADSTIPADSGESKNKSPSRPEIEVNDSASVKPEYSEFTGESGKGDQLGVTRGKLTFDNQCSPGDRVTIAAVGDVLLHGRLQKQAYSEGTSSLWREVQPLMKKADITYANLEGTTAPGVANTREEVEDPDAVFDDYVYSSYPSFNYHPVILDGLESSGVDVVSTANNHSLDRGPLGIDKTIDQLEQRDIGSTGTTQRGDGPRRFWTTTQSQGFNIAWLSCTYGTNGLEDTADQVLYCYRDKQRILETVEKLSERDGVDAVIVTPHWGEQYTATPSDRQTNFNQQLVDSGATAVIGSHPHVIQPWGKYETDSGREAPTLYSLGNFVSGQFGDLATRTTIVYYLGLTRTRNGVEVNGVRFVPAHMSYNDGFLTLEVSEYRPYLTRSRKHAADLLGYYNLQDPKKPLNTTPQCDSDWTPKHPHDGWIGGSCSADRFCGGSQTHCDGQLPGGLCTKPCDRICPDQPGRPTTFCVDMGGSSGSCVLQCEESSECRDGYTCKAVNRYNEPEVTEKVCVPTGY